MRRSFSAGSNSVVSTPSETSRYAPGNRAAAAEPCPPTRRAAVDPAEQPLALRAPRWIDRRSGEKNVATARLSASRSARYDRLGSAGSKPWTTSKRPCRARARGSSARRAGRPSDCAARSARPGRARRARRRRRRRCAARAGPRRGRRAVRRGEDRHARGPARAALCAMPATCSLTSCGCDHANGVTRQIRRAIAAESSPLEREQHLALAHAGVPPSSRNAATAGSSTGKLRATTSPSVRAARSSRARRSRRSARAARRP